MIANSVIMIRPTAFGFNTETALSNSFQTATSMSDTKIHTDALKEFEGLANQLTKHGVDVILFNDTVTPIKPDAVFPNNWFSTHPVGTVFLYPMLSPVRRMERREDIIEHLRQKFLIRQIIDLSPFEQQGKFLEGTGSMVFDQSNKMIYANLSPRSNAGLLKSVADELKYSVCTFNAVDKNGREIYHTNVLMSVSDNLAVVCLDCIVKAKQQLKKELESAGKEIVFITQNQMENFAGNMLMLQNKSAEKFMVMSERAFKSLEAIQIKTIEKHAAILYTSLDVIETIGGGSARCMLAENFLSPL